MVGAKVGGSDCWQFAAAGPWSLEFAAISATAIQPAANQTPSFIPIAQIVDLFPFLDDELQKGIPAGFQRLGLIDGRLSVDATLPVDEIGDKLGIAEMMDEEVDTLGGLVLARLGRMPRVGDKVRLGDRIVEVSSMRGRRILRLAVSPAGPGEKS